MKPLIPILMLGILSPISLWARTPTPTPTPSPTPSDPPKPTIYISFERQAIKENDTIQISTRFSNEWDQGLTNVTLYVDGPSTLTWHASTCEEWKSTSYERGLANYEVKLGPVGPNEVRPTVLCLKSGPSIDVGDFNVSFTYDYAWRKNNIERHSFLATDKPLKANLFGSDSVAGVPIALAAFIVPGLFFWLILGWLKFTWSIEGSPLGDKLIYSVLISLPLLVVVNWVMPTTGAGISFMKLGSYAATGFSVGLLLGIGDWVRRRYKVRKADRAQKLDAENQRIAEEKKVKPGDTPDVLLEKLLNVYPDYHQPHAVLRSADGVEYEGSLAVKQGEVVAVIGTFQIDQSKISGPLRDTIIAELTEAKRSIDRYYVARKYKLRIEGRNPIAKSDDTGYTDLAFALSDKDAAVTSFDADGPEEVLTLQ